MALNIVLACGAGVCLPRRASAQDADRPIEPGTLVLGPVSVRPGLTLSNFGVNSNVFNEAANPKRDLTFTLAPAADVTMHLGRGQFLNTVRPSFEYFDTYATQRSANISEDGRFEFPLNRIILRTYFGVIDTRMRPSLEIDLRARQFVSSLGVGTDIRVFSKTSLRLDTFRARTTFRPDQVVGTTKLSTALNRTSPETDLSVRHELTALTTLVLSGEWLRDRFEFAPARNDTGFRLMPGVEFSKFALISGSASIGIRHLKPQAQNVPPYSGMAGHLSLASVIGETTNVVAQFDRDIAYSFTADHPYYLQTTISVSITKRLASAWDVLGTVGSQRLAYVALAGPLGASAPAANGAPSPTVKGATYGLNVGYHLGSGLTFGFGWQQSSRTAGVVTGNFVSRSWGTSITYGF